MLALLAILDMSTCYHSSASGMRQMQCKKFLIDAAHRKASRGTARDAGWHRDKMERCASTTGQRNMEKRALLNDGAEEVEEWWLASCP